MGGRICIEALATTLPHPPNTHGEKRFCWVLPWTSKNQEKSSKTELEKLLGRRWQMLQILGGFGERMRLLLWPDKKNHLRHPQLNSHGTREPSRADLGTLLVVDLGPPPRHSDAK